MIFPGEWTVRTRTLPWGSPAVGLVGSYLPAFFLLLSLNNTVIAPPRMLIAFLENNLQEDGTVLIPEVLRPYMGGTEKLIPKK